MRIIKRGSWRYSVTVIAVCGVAASLAACTPDTPLGDPTRALRPGDASADEIVDPPSELAVLWATLDLGLSRGAMGVYNEASVTVKASEVRAEVDASITARTSNVGGGAGTAHVVNQCTAYNAYFCATFDIIPDYCHANPLSGEGAPGAIGNGVGRYYARWLEKEAKAELRADDSCPKVTLGYRGGYSTSGSGGIGEVCYEVWLVYPDHSQPDRYIGDVCFTTTGTNAT